MDYQEAIKALQFEGGIEITGNPRRAAEFFDAIDVAISAMQELQEYKQKLNNAYGECDDLLRTVVDGLARHEGIEFCTPIKSRLLTDEDVDLWKGYKQLGTLEEVREAVEKQKKKKPIEDRHHGIRYTEVYRCPSCNGSFSGRGFAKYCFHCGQAIDWGDGD